MKPRTGKLLRAGGTAILSLVLAAGGASIAAQSQETWTFGPLNCASIQILTSGHTYDDVTHHQTSGSIGRSRFFPLPAGLYKWTYYNSGFTSTTHSALNAINDIDAGGRSCDW